MGVGVVKPRLEIICSSFGAMPRPLNDSALLSCAIGVVTSGDPTPARSTDCPRHALRFESGALVNLERTLPDLLINVADFNRQPRISQ